MNDQVFDEMESDRLRLRRILSEDLPNIYKGLSDPKVIKFYGVSYDTLEKTKEQMTWFEDIYKMETGIWWAVVSKETGKFYGGVGFNDWDHKHKRAEIGVWLLPEFWGKGFMTEVMTVAMGYGFNKMKLHRIEAYVRIENTACKGGLKKLNFTYEGTIRDGEIKDDEFISYETHSILKHEYKPFNSMV